MSEPTPEMIKYEIEMKCIAYKCLVVEAIDLDEAIEKAQAELKDEGEDLECWEFESHEVLND